MADRAIRWVASNPRSYESPWYATAIPKAMPPEVLLDAINDVLLIDSDAARDLNSARPRAVRDMIGLAGAVSAELDLLGRCRAANCSAAEGAADSSPAAKLNWVNGDLINALPVPAMVDCTRSLRATDDGDSR
ncbi:MAG: hypothetical protein U0892_21380 [Pirellulales bacterium]